MKLNIRRAPSARHQVGPAIEGLEPRRLLAGYTFHTVANFDAPADGVNPRGVTLDSSGNLFGTSEDGGPSDDGTVFEIAHGTSSITIIASFNGLNGVNPFSGVTLDSNGDLFGTTLYGGSTFVNQGDPGSGTVYEIAHGTNSITTVASFDDRPYAGVTLDSGGNLFGTTEYGGPSGEGTVFEIAAGTSSITTLAAFDNADGSGPITGVTLDSNGNLFGTTRLPTDHNGLPDGPATLFEIAHGTSSLVVLADLDTSSDAPTNLTLDSTGDLFGATEDLIFEVVHGTTVPITVASFNGTNKGTPVSGVTVDSRGDLFGETVNSVFEIAHGTNIISTISTFSFSNADNIPIDEEPQGGLTLDSSGDLFGTAGGSSEGAQAAVFELTAGGVSSTANKLVITGEPANAEPSATLGTITVEVESSTGSLLTTDNSNVTLAINNAPLQGSLGGTTTVAAVNGVATFSNLSIATPGVYRLAATDGSDDYATTTSFTVASPLGEQLLFAQAPAGPTIVAFGTVKVNVEDSSGNIFTGDNSTVTLTIANGLGGVALGGTTTVTAVNGVATFTNLSISQAGGYTLAASDGDIAPATSNTIFVSQPPSALIPSFGKVNLPTTVIFPQNVKGSIHVIITNSGSAPFLGNVVITLYADSGTSLDGNQMFFGSLTGKLSLKSHRSHAFDFHGKLLGPTPDAGTYHVLAEAVDPSNLNNVIATTQTLQVLTPIVDPTVKIGLLRPASIALGGYGSILATVTNTGNVAAKVVDISLYPSPDGISPLSGITLVSISRYTPIPPNRSRTYKLRFRVTSAVPAGNYFPLVMASFGGMDGSGNVMAIGTTQFTVAG